MRGIAGAKPRLDISIAIIAHNVATNETTHFLLTALGSFEVDAPEA
ncbi:MAG: hypothetical protein ACRD22_00920 [Terriglobia bacterium]